jgi:diguanylate cyclase (GGDEF)-like protein/PAS domain S-box-containing protein
MERFELERVFMERLELEQRAVGRVCVERLELERVCVERLELERFELERFELELMRGLRQLGLPRAAWLTILLALGGGGGTLAIAFRAFADGPVISRELTATLLLLTSLVIASWVWPLVMYRGEASEAVHLDEGFLVIMAIVLPSPAVVVGFAFAIVVAQLIRRRPLVKSLFNFGQILSAVGLALLTFHALAGSVHTLSAGVLIAAVVAALVFFAMNTVAFAAILAATGAPLRSALRDGLEIRLLLVGASVAFGLLGALAVTAYPWALGVAVVPMLILRQVLSGHFRARHDRTRLKGLLDATVDFHQAIGDGRVSDVLLDAARTLLRCPSAALVDTPAHDAVSVRLDRGGQWLEVSGRNRSEPFDDADRGLLEALAAVGSGALTNATLFDEVRYERNRLEAITASLGEGVCAVDSEGRVTFVNPAADEMFGGMDVDEHSPQMAPSFLAAPALRAMELRGPVRNDDYTFQRADGSVFPVAFNASPIIGGGVVVGAVIAFRDIAERKVFEEQLARHAFHDALTSLPNRRLFLDHLDHAIRRSTRSNEVHAVLFADVDRFKLINDSLGHHAGDQLLVAIADRLQQALRPGDLLARFGGDEFTVLLENVTDARDAVAVARRIIAQLREPILLGAHETVATLSIGIALTSRDSTRDDILHDADVAMYQAKAKGRTGQYEVFDADAMGARSPERLDLETALRRAVDAGELETYYQPLVSVATGTCIGAEALVRWNHPDRGLLLPGQFIALAEETELILPIGRLVLEQACWRARSWRDQFGVPVSMSVNLSPRQFLQPRLVDEVADILAITGVDPSQICLEITETLAMSDVDWVTNVLLGLKSLGVKVAIDDFGTGYSSLGYLKRFPVDIVKIDRSFVDGMSSSAVDAAIVAAVIGLADAVGMTTVAEGVETREQLDQLRALGCKTVQGFYMAKPMTASAMEALLWAQTEQSVRLVSVARDRLDEGAFDSIGEGLRSTPAFASRAAS